MLLSHLRLSQPGGPHPLIYIPAGTGWPRYTPQELSSLFVTSYYSQGYNGGILTRLHEGSTLHNRASFTGQSVSRSYKRLNLLHSVQKLKLESRYD
jgi:hypothetical protein